MLIRKIFKNNSSGQKLISIPQKSELEDGDYVQLIKIKNPLEEVSLVTDSSRGPIKDNETS